MAGPCTALPDPSQVRESARLILFQVCSPGPQNIWGRSELLLPN